jgi:hypothetical protein
MEQQSKVKLIKVLYCKRGMFCFSKEFREEYEKVGGIWSEIDKDHRTDELVIKIYEKLGREKSSGEKSYIVYDYIPEELKNLYEIEFDWEYFSERIKLDKYKILSNRIEQSEENKKIIDRINFIINYCENQKYNEEGL